MSFSSWIDARIAAAIEKAVPMVVSALTASDGPLVQALATELSKVLVDAVLGPITTQVGSIPGNVAGLLTNELNQLPQQINGLLNIPAVIASAVANVPAEVVNAIKGIIPIPFGEGKKA